MACALMKINHKQKRPPRGGRGGREGAACREVAMGAGFVTGPVYPYPRCSAIPTVALLDEPTAMIALRPTCFQSGFVDVVAMGTKRRPVIHPPEQRAVPLVGDDVIDQGSDQRATVTQVDAPGITREEQPRLFAPAVIVAALGRSWPTRLWRHCATPTVAESRNVQRDATAPTRNTGCDATARALRSVRPIAPRARCDDWR